jgi:diacylglycerol O-acyltransferase
LFSTTSGAIGLANTTPRAAVEHIVNEVFGRKARLDLTTVLGAREPLFLDGKCLRDVMFWVLHPAHPGLDLGMLGYAGKVIVGVGVDEAVTKNPRRLVELFEEEASSMLRSENSSY